MGVEVSVSPSGRMSIPADVRKRLGLESGGKLMLNIDDRGIILTTGSQRVRSVQALYRALMDGKHDPTVDDFLADKRAEAAREAAEIDRDRP